MSVPLTARAGLTEKVSVSLVRDDLRVLRRRAKKLHGGNLSAAVAEAVKLLQEQEGREALVAWLRDVPEATPAEEEAIRAERQPITSATSASVRGRSRDAPPTPRRRR